MTWLPRALQPLKHPMPRPGKHVFLSLDPETGYPCDLWNALRLWSSKPSSLLFHYAIQKQDSNTEWVWALKTYLGQLTWGCGQVAWTARSLHVSPFISAQDLSTTCCQLPSDREWRTEPFSPHPLTSTKTTHEGHHQCLVQENRDHFPTSSHHRKFSSRTTDRGISGTLSFLLFAN